MKTRLFTLVELMIVVAIIGILAAIAIPNFVRMQHTAKRAEFLPNTDGIATAQLAYDAAYDRLVDAFRPGPEVIPRDIGDLNKQAVPWTTGTGFDTLGWAPDGDVRCGYGTFSSDPGGLACLAGQVSVYGVCDVDDNDDEANAVRCADNPGLSFTLLPIETDKF